MDPDNATVINVNGVDYNVSQIFYNGTIFDTPAVSYLDIPSTSTVN